MKKYLVVCLMVCAVLVIGCGFGSEDELATGPTTKTTSTVALSQSLKVQPGFVSTSIRQATYWEEFLLKINTGATVLELKPMSQTTDSDGWVTISFVTNYTKTQLGTAWNDVTKTIGNIEIWEGGQKIITISSLAANDQSTSETGTPNPTPCVLKLTADPTTFALLVTVESGTATVKSEVSSPANTLFLEAAYYKNSSGSLATLTSNVTDVPAPVATFALQFNAQITSATDSWEVKVTNMDKSTSFTLTSTGNSQLFVVTSSTFTGAFGPQTLLTITVVGDSTKYLAFGTNYKVELTNSSIARSDNSAIKFGTVTKTFKTKSS